MTKLSQTGPVTLARLAALCAPALLAAGCVAPAAPPPPVGVAEQALAAAQRAQATADQALALAQQAQAAASASRTASSEMYQRSLRK